MALTRKPVPKSQVELSQETITPFLNQGKAPVPVNKKRENQRTLKGDEVKQFSVGLKDVDESIFYYFNNVIRPSVIQNSIKVNVPVIYGSPERWAAMQKDGYYRDKNGKIQTPLIMVKRDSIEKNRSLGNKMDANNPIHFGVFQKKYSQKNVYDRFSTLNNREPVREYYGVIMPDYVNLVYSCVIFTEYVEQMNKIVESVNFASDSYWGDPERFKFRAAIDNYSTTTELVEGGDRTVKTSFQIKIAGYIVSDAINTNVGNPNKFFSKAAVKFGIETAGSSEILQAKAATPATSAASRFYDQNAGRVTNNQTINQTTVSGSGLTPEERDYLTLQTLIDTNTNAYSIDSGANSITFLNISLATPPAGFPALAKTDFRVFINGLVAEPSAITSITQDGANVVIDFNNTLSYTIVQGMEITSVGKYIV
jgi:hypothetical protein